jgi:hypothetical protein
MPILAGREQMPIWNLPTPTICPAPVTLSAAQWLPIRIMWANGGGPGIFSISIMAPDGTELIGPDLTSSPYLVQYSCDGTSPQYPAWNSET